MKIILASASPRRKELLLKIIPQFEIIPATGGETADKSLPPERYACRLAESKCGEVFAKHGDCLVIGCDTIVVYGGKILGKPKDYNDAVATLKMLSDKTHSVITGVCVRWGDKKIINYASTKVRFNRLTDEFIINYVNGGSPMDKAGSYGIQDGGVVKDFEGSYSNVVGMPLELVGEMIKEITK